MLPKLIRQEDRIEYSLEYSVTRNSQYNVRKCKETQSGWDIDKIKARDPGTILYDEYRLRRLIALVTLGTVPYVPIDQEHSFN